MASSSWHVQTTRDSNTNVIADGPPEFRAGSNIWEFTKDGKTVFVIPREHVLYIKSISTMTKPVPALARA